MHAASSVKGKRRHHHHRKHSRRRVAHLEHLETRAMMSCTSISGYVYNDANNNGLRGVGESRIASTPIALKDSAGNIVATTITDANGFYEFDSDPRIDTSLHALSYSTSFANTRTNWTQQGTLPQFDPALGTLTSVEIVHSGTVVGRIRVENTSTSSAQTISATIGASITLTAPGASVPVAPTSFAGSFNATKFDGALDFAGTSGHDFGFTTATSTTSAILTANTADLSAYIGTGAILISDIAAGTSAATGGGNFAGAVTTTASADITVIYHYIPENCIAPGAYTVVETQQPAGMLDGQETSGNVTAIPNSAGGPDSIPITLGSVNSTENNFGEVTPASLSGFVYSDSNDNGVKESGEAPIAGVTITITGTDDLGAAVSATTTTGADGSYSFTNLRPGTYTASESQPAGYLDGKDTIGSQGGTTGNDLFSAISLSAGTNGVNNNFGELNPASISGFVYVDSNNNGLYEGSESPISGVTATVTGTDDLGAFYTATATTGADGSYSFTDLRPGTYSVSEIQPDGFNDGKDTIGSLGGVTANDLFSQVVLTSGATGAQYNFGEVKPLPPPPPVHTVVLGHGMTATVGFWHNKNGQALIKSCNGSASATQLGNWLATNFPHLYGPTTGASNMTGKTNTQVASYFMTLFNASGQKTAAQVLANALAIYATNSTLAGGTMASSYGFIVNASGTGAATFNVGGNGAAFGVANNTTLTVFQVVKAIDAQAMNGVLYGGNQTLINSANTVSDGINQAGDIV